MKGIPLPVFFVMLLFMVLAWRVNHYLQRWMRPRQSLGRLLLYLLGCIVLVFTGVYAMSRLIIWLLLPAIK